jgi:tetratricopeptide (TPR) repeat protein
MSVDFAYAGASSYRTYLAGLHQREKIDISIAKPVRAAVGAVEEIYGSDWPALKAAVRDFRYGRPGEPFEVLTVNLFYACAAADPVLGDLVSGFHHLFDDDAVVAADIDPASDDDAERLIARIAALTSRQQYSDALAFVKAVLVEYPSVCARDMRFECLRAALLAGVPGQPKSAPVVDLPAAEAAFLKLAARADSERPAGAVAAFVAAGKCAYARGRFADAASHYGSALDRDPNAAEAHYQLARLRMHAGNTRAARELLIVAFCARFSFALRAASDPLFRAEIDLVRSCVIAATRRTGQVARATLDEGLARLRFLARHSDRDHPAEELDRFAPTRAGIAALVKVPAAPTLRKALLQRRVVDATRAPVMQLARDYCDVLRANEEEIAFRDVKLKHVAADPGRVARWLTRGAEVSVVVMLIAVVAGIFDFAAAGAVSDWSATASASAFGLAIATLWLLMHTSFLRRPTRNFFERAVVVAQGWTLARFERRVPRRIARNRRRLHNRIRRIERRFGLDGAAT